jgi:phosphinothricin acetyltransferase
MAPAITIRQATVEDGGAMAAIYAHHVLHGTATFDTVPRTAADTVAKVEECMTRGWPFLVAERDGALVGYAYATQFRDRPAYAAACEDRSICIPTTLDRASARPC